MADRIKFFILFHFKKREINVIEMSDLGNYRLGLSLNNFELDRLKK